MLFYGFLWVTGAVHSLQWLFVIRGQSLIKGGTYVVGFVVPYKIT
jgi:hypothetical protein